MILNPYLLLFIPAYFLAVFIPGDLLTAYLKRPLLQRFVIASAVGLSLWAIQGFVFGYLGARWLTYVYLTIFLVFWLKANLTNFRIRPIKIPKIDLCSTSIVAIGTIANLSAVWFIGVKTTRGLYFCCRGVPDAIYHLSLTNQIIKNFPPFEPGASGVYVKNYHILSNLVAAEFSRVFKIPYIPLQFQFLSLMLALLLGLSAFSIGQILNLKKSFSRWLAIFLYFSGDALFVLFLARGQGLNLSTQLLDDATKLLAGPPRAFSVVLFFAGLSLLVLWIKQKDLKTGLLTALVLGSLLTFKVYTGIFALVGLAALGVYFLYKKDTKMLLVPAVSLIIALTLYLPLNSQAGGLAANGFWRFNDFIASGEIGLNRLELTRLVFAANHKIAKVAVFEIFFIVIYFVFQFGATLIALVQTPKSLKLFPKELHIFLMSGLAFSLIIGSFFIQKTGGTNTVQFLISAFIIAAIYAALSLSYWLGKVPHKLKIAATGFVLVVVCAHAAHEIIYNFKYIANGKGTTISNGELAALSYLKTQTPQSSIIMMGAYRSEEEPYMYISFLANRPLFLAGAGVLRDHGFATYSQKQAVDQVFSSDFESATKVLRANDIGYLYFPKDSSPNFIKNTDVSPVFENNEFEILKIE